METKGTHEQAKATESAKQRAHDQPSETSRGADIMDQTQQALTEAYDKTSSTLNETYDQAIEYGREHPGQLTLIAFGAGIGIGLLLASTFSSRSRIMPPVVDALTGIATEIFRR
jgi:ElaB/YqjD/DUF883 family membrane-anchored ribosome-binding protein